MKPLVFLVDVLAGLLVAVVLVACMFALGAALGTLLFWAGL